MKTANIEPFFATLQAANPEPETELEYTHAVRAAGRGAAVGAGHRHRRQQGHAPAVPGRQHAAGDADARAGADSRSYIKTIGLYRSKAQEPDRDLPHAGRAARRRGAAHAREALEALPGVGRKTANVVLNVAFGEPTMAVDTHIFRVANRTGLAPGKTPLEVELQAVEARAAGLPAARASLADPARPLRLRGAQAAVLAMRGGALLRLQAQDAAPKTREPGRLRA